MLLKIFKLSIFGASFILASCSLFSEKKTPLDGDRFSVLENEGSLRSDYSVSKYKINLPQSVKNQGWYQSGGNSEHRLTNLLGSEEFKRKWKTSFGRGNSKGEFLIASPVISNHVIFTIDTDAVVSAFRMDNGKKIWKRRLKPPYKSQKDITMKGAGLAVSSMQQRLFAATGFGYVYALDIKTGKRIWHFDAEAPIRIAPTIGGGMVFVQTVDNTLIALDAKTGAEEWRFKTSSEQTVLVGGASPAYSLEKDVLIAGFSNGEIRAFKASTGSPLWGDYLIHRARTNSLSAINSIMSYPIISGDVVFAAGNNNILVAIDIKTGKRIWEKEIGTTNPMYMVGSYLFILTNNFELAALSAKDGSIYWTSKLSTGKDLEEKVGAFAAGPLLINNKLIVATSNGYAFAVSPYDGRIIASTKLSDGVEVPPIAAEGLTILTTNDADIIAYE